MTLINHQDLIHIATAALGMAKQDHLLSDKEKQFLKQLMSKAQLKPEELPTSKVDYHAVAGKLSSKRAKQVFLLALAAVAKADMQVGHSESKFLQEMAKELGVGFIDVEMHSRAVLEKMVLDHLQD